MFSAPVGFDGFWNMAHILLRQMVLRPGQHFVKMRKAVKTGYSGFENEVRCDARQPRPRVARIAV